MSSKRMTHDSEAIWRCMVYVDELFYELCDNGAHKLCVCYCLWVEGCLGALTPIDADDVVPTKALSKIKTIFYIQEVVFQVLQIFTS